MKLLVLLPRFPYPLDKGDKLRAYHQIVELSKSYEIYLFALSHERVDDSQLKAMQPYCKAIHVERLCKAACCVNVLTNFVKGEPLQVGYWTTLRAKRAFAKFKDEVQPDIIYRQMIRTAKYDGGGVIDFQDALSLNTQRRMERSHGLMRLVLQYEHKALRRCEQKALKLFKATTVISSVDQAVLSPTVTVVPNGVDTNYFNTNALTQSCNNTFSIVFCGNMSYAPNVDAARYLVEEIMPHVWEYAPYATVLLAGTDPKPAVKALASKKVTVSGRIDDIREAYASSKVFVAPMRIGSGLQNKLLEAMAMHLPCVTTSIANSPLGAVPGDHVMVADSPEKLAIHIGNLLASEDLRTWIADGGHRFVQEHYSWQAAVEPLENILNAKLESK